jgi:hypothetical protein
VCGGVGVGTPQVETILVRRDWGFTPEQARLADLIERHAQTAPRPAGSAADARRLPDNLPWGFDDEPSRCPLCDAPMRRAPWSLAYPLPTDFCGACDLHWFDRDELEVLQILVERQTS